MEQDKGPRELRMRDPRPWVGVGASRHDRPADGDIGEHTAFRRLTSIAPSDAQPNFDQIPTAGDPVVSSHLEDQIHSD